MEEPQTAQEWRINNPKLVMQCDKIAENIHGQLQYLPREKEVLQAIAQQTNAIEDKNALKQPNISSTWPKTGKPKMPPSKNAAQNKKKKTQNNCQKIKRT